MTTTNMRKDDLIALVLANTDEYKKTHLVEMKKDDVLAIAAPFLPAENAETPEQPEAIATEAEQAAVEQEAPADDERPVPEESPVEGHAEATGNDAAESTLAEDPENLSTENLLAKAYEENSKKVKGPRIDKDEFKKTAIELITASLSGTETPAEIRAAMVQTITTLLADKSAFIPMNETEKVMLATLPKMKDFTVDSTIVGKDWLDMVAAQHEISVSSTRALIVSLKKKKYINVKGRNSGEKVTTVQLSERGIRYLTESGALQRDEMNA